MEHISERLDLFRDLVGCAHNLYFSEYQMDFKPICSTAPHEGSIHFLLSMDNLKEYAAQIAASLDLTDISLLKPIIRTNSLGMMWISDLEMQEGVPTKIHVLGPVFTDDFSVRSIEEKLNSLCLSMGVRNEFMRFIHQMPVVSVIRFFEYGLMLHYCLTGERIGISDLSYRNVPKTVESTQMEEPQKTNHGTYLAEQRMLKLVQEGNLEYKKEMDRLISFGNVGKLADNDSIRQAKNSVIIFVALCERAAIAGGLSPDTAFSLGDRYIQNIERCEELSGLTEISRAMRDDFIHRVYKAKASSGISPQIMQACNAISMHPDKKLDIHTLAQQLGYADYYFTKKFKREVGISVSAFSIQCKIDSAKDMLRENMISISNISDWLGFSSPSYFSDMFRRAAGQSPSEYRQNAGLSKEKQVKAK